jgi:Sulfatase-modifying factor enzyme 1
MLLRLPSAPRAWHAMVYALLLSTGGNLASIPSTRGDVGVTSCQGRGQLEPSGSCRGHPAEPAVDPQGPDEALAARYASQTGPSVVIKGGSYLCAPNFCARYRPAARQPQELSLGASHLGFRTVLNLRGKEGARRAAGDSPASAD